MPNSSARAVAMPASPIRRLIPYAVDAEKRGLHVHYLNIGQPDILSPDSFWEGVQKHSGGTLAYSPSPGANEIREATLDFYRSLGIPMEGQDLLVTSGGSEATLFAMISCCNPGDQIIVVEPYYANYLGFAVEAGVELVALTTKIEDNFVLPTADQFRKAISNRTKAILICNPSNPTGTTYTEDQIAALSEIVLEFDLFLIVDEVYRDFNYTSGPIPSILSIPELENNAVMIDSLSKRMSLCGARIGFLASKNKQVMSGATKLAQARLSVATLDQAGAAYAIKNTTPDYFLKVKEEYRSRRDTLVRELNKIEGVICPKIDGAFYALVELPVDDAERFCIWMLQEFSHNKQTLIFAPAEGFYLTPGKGKNQARLAYVLNKEELVEAMECLCEGLKKYPGSLKNSRPKLELAH